MDSNYEMVTSPKSDAGVSGTGLPVPVVAEKPAPAAVAEASSSAVESAAAVTTIATLPVDTTKRTAAAQDAFAAKDASASKAVHDAHKISAAKEDHGGQAADYVKSLIFGGLDGVVTTLATIASAFGAKMTVESIILLSVSNLIAEAISMGLGDFLSSKAEYDFLRAERAREEWEFDNHPEGEKSEMVDLLKGKGIEEADATRIIDLVATPEHKDFFVDYMMIEELNLEIPDDPWGPAKEGFVTFLSFLAFGGIPVWVYVFSWVGKWSSDGGIFGVACGFTVVALFALGATQAKISKLPMVQNGALMAVNGTIACAAAYLVGWGLMKAVCGT